MEWCKRKNITAVKIKEFFESDKTNVSVRVYVLRQLSNFSYEVCDATEKCLMKVENKDANFKVGSYKRIIRPAKNLITLELLSIPKVELYQQKILVSVTFCCKKLTIPKQMRMWPNTKNQRTQITKKKTTSEDHLEIWITHKINLLILNLIQMEQS